MKKLIVLLCLGLFIACSSEDKSAESQQDFSGLERPDVNPFLGEGPMADIEVSDEELKRFVMVSIEFGRIQAESQQKIIDILREEELSMDTYNSISHAIDMGFSLDDYNFSDTDMEKFDISFQRISEVKEEMDEKFEAGIKDANFTTERFLDLNTAAQYNIEVMQRARDMAMNLSEETELQE
jgi:hypothetical protein